MFGIFLLMRGCDIRHEFLGWVFFRTNPETVVIDSAADCRISTPPPSYGESLPPPPYEEVTLGERMRVLRPYPGSSPISESIEIQECEEPEAIAFPTVNWPLPPLPRASINLSFRNDRERESRLRVFPTRNPTHYIIESENSSSSEEDN